MRKILSLKQALVFALLALVASVSLAETRLKPFILASEKTADMAAVVKQTRDALKGAGFTIVGEYSPYDTATVIIVTDDGMKQHAAQSEMGGFGAMQRVTVTRVGDKVQVAYTNPRYLANIYRMKGDLSDVAGRLEKALGKVTAYGSEDGMTPRELRKYHYKIFMPYFDDPEKLGSFDSYQAAIAAVEKGLASKRGGTYKIYRIDIPGKKETVFGVALTSKECGGDAFIMSKIDFGKIKHTPHLPYEVLVTGNKVYMLPAKFRIAINFPDLSMIGSNSFFSIMCAPGRIENMLREMVTGENDDDD